MSNAASFSRRTLLPVLCVITLILVACTPNSSPTATSPKPDREELIPVAGLFFGMSVEEAKTVYPRLTEVETTINGASIARFEPDLILEDVKIFGAAVSVLLRFDVDCNIDNASFWHEFGLTAVTVTFTEPVEKEEVLYQLAGRYDYDRSNTSLSSIELLSKEQIENMDSETLEVLRAYLQEFPFTRRSDGKKLTQDYSALIDKALAEPDNPLLDDRVQPARKYLATGKYVPSSNELTLYGSLAAMLRAAHTSK